MVLEQIEKLEKKIEKIHNILIQIKNYRKEIKD